VHAWALAGTSRTARDPRRRVLRPRSSVRCLRPFERQCPVLASQRVDGRQDRRSADQPELQTALARKLEQHETYENRQDSRARDPRQCQDGAQRNENATDKILCEQARPSEQRMPANRQVARRGAAEIVRRQPYKHEADYKETSDSGHERESQSDEQIGAERFGHVDVSIMLREMAFSGRRGRAGSQVANRQVPRRTRAMPRPAPAGALPACPGAACRH
jgi:hypothetical protein